LSCVWTEQPPRWKVIGSGVQLQGSKNRRWAFSEIPSWPFTLKQAVLENWSTGTTWLVVGRP